MKTISTSDLSRKLAAGPVAVFDVRGDIDYERGHIPGAKTAPMGSLNFRIRDVMNPDSFIVIYSGGGECPLARAAVARLEDLKLTNVHCYEDGFAGWRNAGLSVVESPSPKLIAQGPVVECRPVVVDRENAYGGAFKDAARNLENAGGG